MPAPGTPVSLSTVCTAVRNSSTVFGYGSSSGGCALQRTRRRRQASASDDQSHARIVVAAQSETASSPGTIGRVRGSRPSRAMLPTNARMPRKTSELEDVEAGRARQRLPQEPQHRLGDRHGPHRSVEVAALVPFSGRRGFDARQLAERAEHPERAGDREVEHLVHLLQPPLAGDDRVEQPAGVQHRERDDLAPRGGVADAAIERVGAILGEANDVRRRLAAGQLAEQSGDPGAEQHDRQAT